MEWFSGYNCHLIHLKHIILVGGVAESEYVFSKLNQWATKQRISIGKPDGVSSKAIAHGALSWHLRSAVRIRIAKYHYGAETDLIYAQNDSEMSGRKRFQNILGETRVRGAWQPIVAKVGTGILCHCSPSELDFRAKDWVNILSSLHHFTIILVNMIHLWLSWRFLHIVGRLHPSFSEIKVRPSPLT